MLSKTIAIPVLVVLMAASPVAAQNAGSEARSGANPTQLAQAAPAIQPSNGAAAPNAQPSYAPGQPGPGAAPAEAGSSPGSVGSTPYGRPLGGMSARTTVNTQPRFGPQASEIPAYGQGQPAFGYTDPMQPQGVFSQPVGAAAAPPLGSQNLGASGALGPLVPLMPAGATDLKAPH